jgi:hypothetical protein
MAENNNSIGLNELVDYQKKTYSPTMDRIMKFLWKCAGSDPQILQYAPYSDHIKNAGIGGVVLATTVMATLAMGFAMHTIFAEPDPSGEIDKITGEVVLRGQWLITIPISIVWGLIIFNLDRFIVSTVKGDGTEKITWGEWGAMLPRLFMAILIGLTISAPLETYIFKREIQREWKLSMDKLALAKKYEIQQAEDQMQKSNDSNYVLKKKEVEVQKITWEKANQAWEDQMQGRTGQGIGRGERTIALEKVRDAEKDRLRILEAELKILEDKKNGNVDVVKQKQDSEMAKVRKETPGFLDQIMMLEKLSAHGKDVEKYNAATGGIEIEEDSQGKTIAKKEEIYGKAFWPIWLVRLLFMIIEIAPVIFKFMIWKSSYDYMQDNVAQILEAKQGISLDNKLDENNKITTIRENYNARRIVEVSKRQNDLEKENAIHAITLFAEKERGEIEKNPENFVKQETTDPNIQIENKINPQPPVV